MMAEKAELRRMMRARRKAVSAAVRVAASQSVCEKLLSRADVRTAIAERKPIAVYLASADELDLTPFIETALAQGAVLVAPRWNGSVYELGRLKSLDQTVKGPHGILEPPCAAEDLPPPSVWLVPGLAFTSDGKRLGYGGGWYDRLLAGAMQRPVLTQHGRARTPAAPLKLGISFRCQLLPDLPSEPHDILLDAIVSDRGASVNFKPSSTRSSPSVFADAPQRVSAPLRRWYFAIILGMEKLATDIYSFRKLRESGFTYVDKTAMLLPLCDLSIGSQFFLARPRRFGKSLLVSTLRCLFEGRRELFTGLAIEPKWDWSKSWPVLHLDMGSCQAETVEELWDNVRLMLESEAVRLGMSLRKGERAPGQFRILIEDLAAKSSDGQVVLLVDEYDKPLLGHLSKPDVTRFRDALKEFYSVVKTLEAKQRFTFITGVSKFSKVSIFSDLNNLIDLTMTPGEATLLGYTHDELKRFFPETIKKIAAANGLDEEGAFAKIVRWYDGYRFEENAGRVINPVSFGLCAKNGKFQNYWANTATPTFLIDALKAQPLDFSSIDITQSLLESYEPENPRLVTLLYQTGYLTIRSFRQIGENRKYTLGFPNYEVTDSFLSSLAPVYAGLADTQSVNYQLTAQEALLAGDVDRFVKMLKNFFANIPYNLTDRQNEQMWQTIVYVILKAIGAAVNAEVMTNEGRIDMICETPSYVWLVEFKLDRPAEEALAQIEEKNYAAKYDLTGKTVLKLGVSFSSEKRTIVDVCGG